MHRDSRPCFVIIYFDYFYFALLLPFHSCFPLKVSLLLALLIPLYFPNACFFFTFFLESSMFLSLKNNEQNNNISQYIVVVLLGTCRTRERFH